MNIIEGKLTTEGGVSVLSEDGKEIRYTFTLQQSGDVCTMLIHAADACGDAIKLKDGDHYVGAVLRAQADMIMKGLHVKDHDPDMMSDMEKFHQKFGLEYHGLPRMLEPELFGFRSKFLEEELQEWRDEQDGLVTAMTADDGSPDHRAVAHGLHQQLDALVDLVYVALGTAYLQFGRKVFNEAWRRVQTANMAKVRAQKSGDSKRGSTFDVVKPEGWRPPDHHDLVKDHAHIKYVHQGEINPEHLAPVAAESDFTDVPSGMNAQ